MRFEAVILIATGLMCASTMFASPACTAQQLSQVQDASQKRQVICDFVHVWAPGQPELKRLDELCKAGAELKAIAAAYAECPAEAKP